jgi:hypothetical protein
MPDEVKRDRPSIGYEANDVGFYCKEETDAMLDAKDAELATLRAELDRMYKAGIAPASVQRLSCHGSAEHAQETTYRIYGSDGYQRDFDSIEKAQEYFSYQVRMSNISSILQRRCTTVTVLDRKETLV